MRKKLRRYSFGGALDEQSPIVMASRAPISFAPQAPILPQSIESVFTPWGSIPKDKFIERYGQKVFDKTVGAKPARFPQYQKFDEGGEVEEPNEIEMSKSSFMKEHKRLLKVLKSGSKTDRLKEYERQSTEVSKYGLGGFLQNVGVGLGDNALSLFGGGNLLDDAYTKDGQGRTFRGITDVTGKIQEIGGQAAATALGGPMAGAALGQFQSGLKGATQSNKPQRNTQMIGDQLGNIAGLGAQFYAGNPVPTFGKGGVNMYGYGGVTPAEVEGEENVQLPNGFGVQFDGPLHQNGGIPTMLPEGSKVFSDRLKPLGSKKTFAELNKPNVSSINKSTKLSDNIGGQDRRYSNNTMDMTNKKSDRLFNEQEELKEMNFNKDLSKVYKKYGYGGNIFKSPILKNGYPTAPLPNGLETPDYAYGGDVTDDTNPYDFNNLQGPANMGPSTYGSTRVATPNLEGYNNPESNPNATSFNWNKALNTAGTYAPVAYNVGMGLFSKVNKLNPSDYQVNTPIKWDDISDDTSRRDINSSYNQGLYNMKNSGNYRLSGQIGLANSKADQLARSSERISNLNKQGRFSALQSDINRQFQNKEARFKVEDYNNQAYGARQQMLARGLGQVSEIAQKNDYNNKYMDLLPSIFDNPFSQRTFNDYKANNSWRIKRGR